MTTFDRLLETGLRFCNKGYSKKIKIKMSKKKEVWLFAANFIANAIGINYTIALIIAKFHLDALGANNADPDWAAREGIFQIKYDTLVDAAVSKDVTTGGREADTATLKEMFQTITATELPLWQNQIAAVYPAKSTAYKAFFPRGVADITEGRMDNKIKAVQALAKATLDDGGLGAVSALITTRFDELNKKRHGQLIKKSTITGTIGDQIAAIADMCDAHFIDHGIAISKYSTDPKKIQSFVDLVTLQQHEHSLTYAGIVNGTKLKTAFKRKYTLKTNFLVTSTVDVQVWVIDSSKNIVKPTGVFIPANTPTNVGFPPVGNVLNRVFQVKNLTATKGQYTIVISEMA